MRIGLFGILPGVPGIAGDGPLDDLLARIQKAEADGFAGFWAAGNTNLETLSVLMLAGRQTSTVRLK
jgi:alkanesulfonate monooxygenase SsuD/methylene tetrahydromethanopterin reductase-like flavin-dependent oxidoreductase (luciferase family)